MASIIINPGATPLADTEACLAFFQQQLLHNLNYWQQHPAIQTVDVTVLEGRHESILKTISFGLHLPATWPTTRNLIITFAPFMERQGYWGVWQTILEQAIDRARQIADAPGETTLTAFLARLSQRQSRPQATIRHYRRVIHLARQTNNQFEEARACSNLGYAYIDGNHWWRCEVLSQHALAMFEVLDSDHGRAHTHSHLGVLYTRKGQWENAQLHLQTACKIWQKIGDSHSLIYGYENLGSLYFEMSMGEDALRYFKKALDCAKTVGEETELRTIWLNIGITYWLMENFAQAELYTKAAERLCQQYVHSIELAQVQENLGNIYLSQEKISEARRYFEAALETYTQLGNQVRRAKVLKIMTDHHLTL